MNVAMSFPGCHRRGGVERITFECASFLAARGHDVHVYANRWEPDPDGRVRFHHVPMPRQPPFFRVAWYYRAATKRVARAEHEVLNTHGCICPTGGVHWVQSVHRAWLDRAKQFRPKFSLPWLKQSANPLHPVLLNLEKRHFRDRRYRKLIATTKEVKDDLARYYAVPGEDVVVIPNGFSPTEFNPQRRAERRDEMRQKLGLSPDQLVLLFVANELERKGYAALLTALRTLRRPEIKVLVVGRVDAQRARHLADAAGVGEQVVVCGSTDDVAGYHAAGDAFVLPTQYEAFALAILEALGSGLPVVTTRVPGAKDAIQNERNGLLIDPNNADQLAGAIEVLLDRSRLAELSDHASASVAAYQWPTVLEKYEQVLQECSTSHP